MNIYEEKRPWGEFRRFTLNEQTTVKLITVKAGEAFSLQYHQKRDEFWHITKGHAWVTVGEERKEAKTGDEFFIKIGQNHRLEAIEDTQFLEIAFGQFAEDEIVRVEDKYNRK